MELLGKISQQTQKTTKIKVCRSSSLLNTGACCMIILLCSLKGDVMILMKSTRQGQDYGL